MNILTSLRSLRTSTVRLALSYLVIIMALSISFSVIFYRTSMGGLQMQSTVSNDEKVQQPQTEKNPIAVGSVTNSNGTITVGSATIAEVNAELQKRIGEVRADLARRLVILNIGALLVGGILSVFLARKTLRPVEAAMEAQSRFSSDASHELRTPLTALRARNEVALRNPKLSLAQAKRIMQESVDQVIKLEHLSDGLLRLSREGALHSIKEPVSLEEIANEAMNQVLTAAQAKRISIEETVPHITVTGEVQSMVHIVKILLDNAIKYSDPGSIIYLEGDAEGKYGVLSVRDEGYGIRATDLPRIFERFYRADYARVKHGEHGYGLGLSIAQKLASQNGSTLTVKSVIDQGSTFSLRTPLSKP